MTQRLPDWNERFDALVRSAIKRPFAWGVHDCCLWSADSVKALTGVDPAKQWRGTYRDMQGAARLLKRLGGLRKLADRYAPRIHPNFAQPGDIGLVFGVGRTCLSVFQGEVWMSVAESGLVLSSREMAHIAWGIGHAAGDC